MSSFKKQELLGSPLTRSFYCASATEVAPRLLGKILVYNGPHGLLAGIIVEVEAYYEADPASHSFRGLTPRTKTMFGPSGHAYVYFIYGIHWCCNVVCGRNGQGDAVLIRALEPLYGIDVMSMLRNQTKLVELCSGPAKLTQALGITGELNGTDITDSPLYICGEHEVATESIQIGTRIGISVAQGAPLRFSIKGNSYVSRQNLL